jgi:Holliday junction resolvase RusA-like endonuclease
LILIIEKTLRDGSELIYLNLVTKEVVIPNNRVCVIQSDKDFDNLVKAATDSLINKGYYSTVGQSFKIKGVL